MVWTIIWVAAVTLFCLALAGAGIRAQRTGRANGTVAIAAAAIVWSLVRWLLIDVHWFLIRSMGVVWCFWIVVLAVLAIVLASASRKWDDWLAYASLLLAVLVPFTDVFSAEMWYVSAPWGWWALIALLLIGGIVLLLMKGGVVKLIGLVLVFAFIVAAGGFGIANIFSVGNPFGVKQAKTATTSSQAAKTPTATPSATETPAGNDGSADVQNRDGSKEVVPLVLSAPDTPSASTVKDPMTPPTISASVCPTLENWKTLVDCVEGHDMQWFIDGVNQRATKTGFDWSNIKRWANASNVDTVEVRAIEVFGGGISDAEARQRTAELVGQAANMAIVRQPHCFSNTRGLENSTMQDFVYCPPNSRQVRVSLLPVVMENGAIVGIRDTQSGVFVDCLNVWWIPPVVKVDGVPPQTPPAPKPVPKPKPKPSPTPQPGPSEKPSPTCPPGMHGKPPLCKDDPAKDPAAQGNAPTGGGKNADPGPGVPNPQPTFRPDPRPNPTPPPAPAPTPRPAPAPPPETQAPQPSAPVTQCIPAPGETSC